MFVWVVCVFKQKTAYEMRISDWSSDVCSSDLQGPQEERLARLGVVYPRHVARQGRRREARHAGVERGQAVVVLGKESLQVLSLAHVDPPQRRAVRDKPEFLPGRPRPPVVAQHGCHSEAQREERQQAGPAAGKIAVERNSAGKS